MRFLCDCSADVSAFVSFRFSLRPFEDGKDDAGADFAIAADDDDDDDDDDDGEDDDDDDEDDDDFEDDFEDPGLRWGWRWSP